MKVLKTRIEALERAGRWDIDFHLPPVGIQEFPQEIVVSVATCADVVKTKRDPTLKPDQPFLYVDIASVDVETGTIARPQELTGGEAPSRARKVIHAYDLIVSTCRPTRGAIAVVPEELHGQICSTGFCVLRVKDGHNPFFLHFALRLPSTLEQFRKWSTGSSYPAILDEDVSKTRVPVPVIGAQDQIAKVIRSAVAARERAIQAANDAWEKATSSITGSLSTRQPVACDAVTGDFTYSVEQIKARIAALEPVVEEPISPEDELLEQSLFEELEGSNESESAGDD